MGLAMPHTNFPKFSTDDKIYSLTIMNDTEPEIDIDELACIIQQLEAISMGYGHYWGKTFIKQEPIIQQIYKWENPDV